MGLLGLLSEFPSVLSPLVTVLGPVTVGGSLRSDEICVVLLSNGLAVLGVSLTDGGAPSGPSISGGAGGRVRREVEDGLAICRFWSFDGGCRTEAIVPVLPLVAVLGPGRSCSQEGQLVTVTGKA